PAAAAAPAPGDGREGQRRLSAATVTVLGLGRAGSSTARALALAGVGRLRLADARPVAADDVWGGGFFDDGDLGRPRAEALAARVRRCNGDVQAQAVPWSGGEPAEQVRSVVEGSTLAVLCPDDFHPRDYDAVNEACIAAGVTWINRRALGFDVTVGPMVIPGESPCYRCFELRSLGNLMDPAERMKLHAHLDHAALESGALPVAAGVEILVTECLKRLSGIGPPSTVGSVAFLSPTSVDVRRRPLLRIPRCPACGRGARDRPRMDPWAHFLE
ncbi:MAG TPA: TOMM precursor leader peptide-binding protein, partial [Longimicrobium sp.]|nr:TOMM precursor leader peptide-binding protein [Longimicrobium sp.]